MAASVLEVTPRRAVLERQEGMGLSDEELAAALGATQRTVQRWRAGTAFPQQLARQRLAQLLDLQQRVRDTFGDESVRHWFHSNSRCLGGITPAEAIRAGRVDRAEAALDAMDAGIAL